MTTNHIINGKKISKKLKSVRSQKESEQIGSTELLFEFGRKDQLYFYKCQKWQLNKKSSNSHSFDDH